MSYKIVFALKANKDIERIEKSGNKKLLKKLDSLLEELKEHPKTGTGKPEQLKHYEIPYLVTQGFGRAPIGLPHTR